jgi:eukaryotic-like serine/threonine-protein kinase
MDPAIDQVLLPRYELLNMIGRGGHSVVYRAVDRQKPGDEVAIKILHPSLTLDSAHAIRMRREWQAMRELAGTNAVQVFELCQAANGSLCLVMELLIGRDLDGYLTELESWDVPFPVDTLLELLDPIVDTLEAAHFRGIVHRDLKPGNIYVLDAARGGGVRLIDFGLVKLLHAPPLTRDGFVVGSPSYMAPEVWSGNPRALDHRVDVYSFGAIVFRVLSGEVPFDALRITEKLRLATTAERPSLCALRPDLPPRVDDWVRHALAIEPSDRFTSMRELWDDLRASMRDEAPVSAAM